MSDYVNTVDLIGDEALTDSIIDRSITEIVDDQVTTVGYGAFWSCKKLTKAVFPSAISVENYGFRDCSILVDIHLPLVTSIGTYAFYNSDKIDVADFPALTYIGANAFAQSGGWQALILRSETMCALANANAFSSSAFSAGRAYIYVPKALLSDYKAATNWSTYAAQIRAIEDYPEITGG